MNRNEFIQELSKKLEGYPKEDVQKTIDFYNEIIEDKLEDGISEEEAVLSLGTIEEIVKNFLNEMPLKKLVKNKIKDKKMSTSLVVLLSSTAIIWLPVLIALTAILISIYASLWAVVISLFAVAFSCIVLFLLALVGIIFIVSSNVATGLIWIALGLTSCGVGLLLWILTVYLSKSLVNFTKWMILQIKKSFIKRGEINE